MLTPSKKKYWDGSGHSPTGRKSVASHEEGVILYLKEGCVWRKHYTRELGDGCPRLFANGKPNRIKSNENKSKLKEHTSTDSQKP